MLKNLTAAIALVVLASVFSVTALAGTPKPISVPPGDLTAALEAISKQAGVELLFDENQLKGLRSNGVSGTLTPEEAIRKLLEGTSLELSTDETTGAMMIGRSRQTGTRISRVGSPARLAQTAGSGGVQKVAGGSPGSSVAAESTDESNKGITEVVVTATKRAERIQDVPLSITAITADDIDRKGLVSGEDYLRGLPGVNQAGGGGSYGGNLIVVRGMQTSLRPEGGNGTTGTYFGETPTAGSAGSYGSNVDIRLVDIERVEVLRGPQGTAFGSSSLGGTVRVIPVAPKLDRYEGRLSAGYSVTEGPGGDNSMYQGVGNLPLIVDKLAIRAVGYTFSDSGYYRNRAGSNAAYLNGFAIPLGAQALATDEEGVGAYRASGGRISALWQASEDLRLTLGYMVHDNEMDGFAVQNSASYEQQMLRVAPQHVRRGQNGGYHDNRISIANALLEYDLGWADLIGSYSHLEGDNAFAASTEFIALPWAASYGVPSSLRRNVGEIRIATRFSGRWNFLAGLYTERNDTRSIVEILWAADPATNFLAPGQRLILNNFTRGDARQNAAFGEVSWKLASTLTLTGGVRAFDYETHSLVDQTGVFGTISGQRLGMDESGQIYRVNLSYKPGNEALLYAGWSQGFRLGSAGVPPPSNTCDVDGDGILDGTTARLESVGDIFSDTVDNYELGGKLALLNRRLILDAAVFRMEWSDIPVNVRLPCSFSYVGNAAGARSEGVELQASFQALDSVRIDLGGSYVDARLTTPVPALNVPAGRPLSGTPEVNLNFGLQHDMKLAGRDASVRIDSIYVGPFDANITLPPNTRAGDYIKVDASARVMLKSFNIDLFVHNLTNESAFTFRDAVNRGALYGYRMRPRTVGMQFSLDF